MIKRNSFMALVREKSWVLHRGASPLNRGGFRLVNSHVLICGGIMPAILLILIACTVLNAFEPTALPAPASGAAALALPAGVDSFVSPTASGTPVAGSPAIAEFTRSAGPGDVIVLSGLRFSSHEAASPAFGRDTRFVVWARNDAGSVVQADADIIALRPDLATISLPSSLPSWRTYVLWPVNATGTGWPVLLNRTELWWLGPSQSSRGDLVGLHGRNLSREDGTTDSAIWIQRADGTAGRFVQPTRVNPYRVEFLVPADLADGVWRVYVHNRHGGAWGWSEAQTLNVGPFGEWTGPVLDASTYGVITNDGLDDSSALAAAVTALRAAPAAASLRLPSGVIELSAPLPNFDNRRIFGAGMDATLLRCRPGYGSGTTNFFPPLPAGSGYELADLSLDTGGNQKSYLGDSVGRLRDSNRLRFNRVRFSQLLDSGTGANLDLHGSRSLLFVDCEFIIASGIFCGVSTDLTFRDCTFLGRADVSSMISIWGGGRVAFVDCLARDYDNTTATGWAQGRFFVAQSHWGTVDSIYIGSSTTIDLGVRPGYTANQNTGEQILTEGGMNDWIGKPLSAELGYVVLPGTGDFSTAVGDSLAVAEGPARGQSRRITGWDAATRRLHLDQPFSVPPTAESTLNIGRYFSRLVVYECTLDGKAEQVTASAHTASAALEPYGAALDTIFRDNRISDVRNGIVFFWISHKTFDGASLGSPYFFTLSEGNTLANVRRGLTFQNFYGDFDNALALTRPTTSNESFLGTLFRRNTINGSFEQPYYAFSSIPVDGDGGEAMTMTVIDGLSVTNARRPHSIEGHRLGEQILRNIVTAPSVGGTITAPFTFSAAGGSEGYLDGITSPGYSTLHTGPGAPGPRLSVPRRVITLRPSSSGWSATAPIRNLGSAPLTWSASTDSPWLQISPSTASIPAAGGESQLTLSASGIPARAGPAFVILSSDGGTQQITVLPPSDNTIPAAPSAPTLSGNGGSTPTLSGYALPHWMVQILIDGRITRIARPDIAGNWSIALGDLHSGLHLATVRHLDGEGRAGPWSTAVFFSREGPPASPVAPSVILDQTPNAAVEGDGPPGATVLLRIDGNDFAEVPIDSEGRWRASLAGTSSGQHEITVAHRLGVTLSTWSAPAFFTTPAASSGGTGLTATYHDDATFTTPAYTQIDSLIAFNWSDNRPIIPPLTTPPTPAITKPTFSVIWTGSIIAPLGGLHRFELIMGGPAELWIDDVRIIGGFTNQWNARLSGEAMLEAGRRHKVRIQYSDTGGDFRLVFSWRGPGRPAGFVSGSDLHPELPVPGLALPPTPAAPIVDGQDTAEPVVSGLAAPGVRILIQVDGVGVGSTVAASDGNWRFTLPASTTRGPRTIRVAARNGAGVSSLSAPATARVTSLATPSSATFLDNGLPHPIITGTGTPGALITVFRFTGALLGQARVDANGRWRFVLRGLPNTGFESVRVTETNPLGTSGLSASSAGHNRRAFTGTLPNPPSAPVVLDGGTSRVRLIGEGDPLTRLMILVNGVQHSLIDIDSLGRWDWDASLLPPGTHSLRFIAIHGSTAQGGVRASADSAPLEIIVGTLAPAPRAPSAVGTPEVIASADGTLLASGLAAPFEFIELRSGSHLVGRAWADGQGRWNATLHNPVPGPFSLFARAINSLGAGPASPVTIGQNSLPSALDSYGRWLGQHSLPMDASGLGSPDADPDADGLRNLLEYGLALSPLAPDPSPMTALQVSGLGTQLPSCHFTFIRARPDLVYTLEASSDLSTWEIIATNPGVISASTPVDVHVPNSGVRRFFRLRVSP